MKQTAEIFGEAATRLAIDCVVFSYLTQVADLIEKDPGKYREKEVDMVTATLNGIELLVMERLDALIKERGLKVRAADIAHVVDQVVKDVISA